jgi:CheY-like chemotaxis protein
MSRSDNHADAIETVRLSDQQSQEILDRLDKSEQQQSDQKQPKKYSFRSQIRLHVLTGAGNEASCFRLSSRTISTRELSILHGGYLHKGTLCLLGMYNAKQQWTIHFTKVVDCYYVSGNIHEVIVKFERDINPGEYMPQTTPLSCTLAEEDPSKAEKARKLLHHNQVHVEHIHAAYDVVKKTLDKAYDLLLLNMQMRGIDGISAVRLLRKRSFKGVIVAVTEKQDHDALETYKKAGCDRVISSDYSPEQIRQLVEEVRSPESKNNGSQGA